MNTNDPKTLFDGFIFSAFLQHLKTENSRLQYKRAKEDIENLCGKPFMELTSNDALFYVNLMSPTLSKSTIVMRIHCLASIGNYCEQNSGDYLKDTPYEHYHSPFHNLLYSFPRKMFVEEKKIPSMKEISTFLSKATDEIRLVSSIILRLGLTGNEVTSFMPKKIIKSESEVVYEIRRKGQSSLLMIPEDLFSLIEQYIIAHGISLDGYLFQNAKGKKLSERTLQQHYKKECERLQFPYTMSDLRNTSASLMLLGGAKFEDVCDFIGISTKEPYRFREAVDKLRVQDTSNYNVIQFDFRI